MTAGLGLTVEAQRAMAASSQEPAGSAAIKGQRGRAPGFAASGVHQDLGTIDGQILHRLGIGLEELSQFRTAKPMVAFLVRPLRPALWEPAGNPARKSNPWSTPNHQQRD